MIITRTISLLKPAGFESAALTKYLVAVCHHGRLREALLSSMSAPKRLKDVYTRQLTGSETVRLESPGKGESLEQYTAWDFALLTTYSFVLVFCTTMVLKVL